MNSRTTKAKRKAIPFLTLAEVDKRDGVERFDHLIDSLDKWLAEQDRGRLLQKATADLIEPDQAVITQPS